MINARNKYIKDELIYLVIKIKIKIRSKNKKKKG